MKKMWLGGENYVDGIDKKSRILESRDVQNKHVQQNCRNCQRSKLQVNKYLRNYKYSSRISLVEKHRNLLVQNMAEFMMFELKL